VDMYWIPISYSKGTFETQNTFIAINPFLTSRTYMSHLQRVFQVSWDNSIPLFLHAAIYLEVSLFPWTSQNAFSRETAVYKWYCVQCCIASLHTAWFVHGKMHSEWFNRIEILQGRWHYGEIVGYCYLSGLEKTLCKWDMYIPLVKKGLMQPNQPFTHTTGRIAARNDKQQLLNKIKVAYIVINTLMASCCQKGFVKPKCILRIFCTVQSILR